MVDLYGRWKYKPNTPEDKKCDMDKIAEFILNSGYTPKTDLENLVVMMILHFDNNENLDCLDEFVEANGGFKEFDYYA